MRTDDAAVRHKNAQDQQGHQLSLSSRRCPHVESLNP